MECPFTQVFDNLEVFANCTQRISANFRALQAAAVDIEKTPAVEMSA
jgi:hypothetical protein